MKKKPYLDKDLKDSINELVVYLKEKKIETYFICLSFLSEELFAEKYKKLLKIYAYDEEIYYYLIIPEKNNNMYYINVYLGKKIEANEFVLIPNSIVLENIFLKLKNHYTVYYVSFFINSNELRGPFNCVADAIYVYYAELINYGVNNLHKKTINKIKILSDHRGEIFPREEPKIKPVLILLLGAFIVAGLICKKIVYCVSIKEIPLQLILDLNALNLNQFLTQSEKQKIYHSIQDFIHVGLNNNLTAFNIEFVSFKQEFILNQRGCDHKHLIKHLAVKLINPASSNFLNNLELEILKYKNLGLIKFDLIMSLTHSHTIPTNSGQIVNVHIAEFDLKGKQIDQYLIPMIKLSPQIVLESFLSQDDSLKIFYDKTHLQIIEEFKKRLCMYRGMPTFYHIPKD